MHSQADLGLFSHSYNPNNGPNKEDQYKTASLVQGVAALFALPSVHLGRVAGGLLCQDETAFLELLLQLGKAVKRKGITLANTGDPEISQPLGILPS